MAETPSTPLIERLAKIVEKPPYRGGYDPLNCKGVAQEIAQAVVEAIAKETCIHCRRLVEDEWLPAKWTEFGGSTSWYHLDDHHFPTVAVSCHAKELRAAAKALGIGGGE